MRHKAEHVIRSIPSSEAFPEQMKLIRNFTRDREAANRNLKRDLNGWVGEQVSWIGA
jgi:hypothetical protein